MSAHLRLVHLVCWYVTPPLRASKLALLVFLTILPLASLFTTPLKGDSPSLRRDFETYLKTNVMEFVEAATYLEDCISPTCLSSSLLCCCFKQSCPIATYTSLVAFKSPLQVEQIADIVISLGARPSSKNLAQGNITLP